MASVTKRSLGHRRKASARFGDSSYKSLGRDLRLPHPWFPYLRAYCISTGQKVGRRSRRGACGPNKGGACQIQTPHPRMTGSEGMEPAQPVCNGRHLSIISSSRSKEDQIERAYHYTSPLPRAVGDAMGKGIGGATHRRPSLSNNAGWGEAVASAPDDATDGCGLLPGQKTDAMIVHLKAYNLDSDRIVPAGRVSVFWLEIQGSTRASIPFCGMVAGTSTRGLAS
eukprot:Gb_14260 [translate_table: standard]